MTLDAEDREAMADALNIAKEKYFWDLLDMNRQRVEDPEAWNEKEWLRLSKKYNAVSKLGNTLAKEAEMAQA